MSSNYSDHSFDVDMDSTDASPYADHFEIMGFDNPSSSTFVQVNVPTKGDALRCKLCIFPEGVRAEIDSRVLQTCELTALAPDEAKLVLLEFRWDVNKLSESWFDDAAKICKKIGLTTNVVDHSDDPELKRGAGSSGGAVMGGTTSTSGAGGRHIGAGGGGAGSSGAALVSSPSIKDPLTCSVCFSSYADVAQDLGVGDHARAVSSAGSLGGGVGVLGGGAGGSVAGASSGGPNGNAAGEERIRAERAAALRTVASSLADGRGAAGGAVCQAAGSFALPCGHRFCVECWQRHICVGIEDGNTCIIAKGTGRFT